MEINLNKLRDAGYDIDLSDDIIRIIPKDTMYLNGLSQDLRSTHFTSDYDREVCMEKVAELIQTEQIKSVLFGEG